MVNFEDLGYDVIAGTVLGAIGAVVELTSGTLAHSAMPTLFTATSVPMFAGIVGLGFFVASVFGKIGSKMVKQSSQ